MDKAIVKRWSKIGFHKSLVSTKYQRFELIFDKLTLNSVLMNPSHGLYKIRTGAFKDEKKIIFDSFKLITSQGAIFKSRTKSYAS